MVINPAMARPLSRQRRRGHKKMSESHSDLAHAVRFYAIMQRHNDPVPPPGNCPARRDQMMTERTAANTPERPSRADWQARIGEIGKMHGFFERLGRDHFALYVQEGNTLLVSFDEIDRVIEKGDDALPVGFEAVKKREWSMLSILSDGRTWFRDQGLYRFFDKLSDEGFFDSFDQVIFLGAGPMCGHAAAA